MGTTCSDQLMFLRQASMEGCISESTRRPNGASIRPDKRAALNTSSVDQSMKLSFKATNTNRHAQDITTCTKHRSINQKDTNAGNSSKNGVLILENSVASWLVKQHTKKDFSGRPIACNSTSPKVCSAICLSNNASW